MLTSREEDLPSSYLEHRRALVGRQTRKTEITDHPTAEVEDVVSHCTQCGRRSQLVQLTEVNDVLV